MTFLPEYNHLKLFFDSWVARKFYTELTLIHIAAKIQTPI